VAIQRCPYCKAIIDEGAEFCTNCGTQLLFPEDEHIEEEIPGEKIVGEEDEEEELETETKSEEEDVIELPDDLEEKKELAAESSDIIEPEEVAPEEEAPEEIVEEVAVLDEGKQEADLEMETAAEGEGSRFEEVEPESSEDEVEEPFEPEDDLDEELEGLKKDTNSETIQKEEIEKFVASLKRDREAEEEIVESEEELPPWAAGIKEGEAPDLPVTDEEIVEVLPQDSEEEDVEERVYDTEEEATGEPALGTEEETLPDTEPTPEEGLPDMDTESALPETVDQQDLPFVGEPEREVIIERSKPLRSETSSKITSWMKARFFDVLFITAVWFIALWVASQMLAVSVFQLIATSTNSILLFLGILLAFYFFFFYFFLKETLGDYLFTQDK
jgi:hypothetical protein